MIEQHTTAAIVLEEAVIGDAAEITAVHIGAERSIYPDVERHHALPTLEEIEEYHDEGNFADRWRKSHEREIFYEPHISVQVARLGKAIVGFSTYDSQINWLNSLYVAPEYQGFGIGSRLLKSCLHAAGPNPTKLLTVEHSSAVGFYRQHGFISGESAPKGRQTRVNSVSHIPLIGMIYIPETTAV